VSGIGRSPERTESVTAFRDRLLGAPDVVPVRFTCSILGLAQERCGALEVPRVPQGNCGDEEVQARSAVLLVLVVRRGFARGDGMKTARARLLRVSPLLSSRLV
jgi:hypothetical protein